MYCVRKVPCSNYTGVKILYVNKSWGAKYEVANMGGVRIVGCSKCGLVKIVRCSNMGWSKWELFNMWGAKVYEQTYLSNNNILQWRPNGRDGVSNHQPHDCLLNRLFRRRSKKTSKLCVTGLCVGNSPVTGEFPALRASNAENVSIWWRHHEKCMKWIDCDCR